MPWPTESENMARSLQVFVESITKCCEVIEVVHTWVDPETYPVNFTKSTPSDLDMHCKHYQDGVAPQRTFA
jgi:hypothetical protein